jgi:hypothetical protein
VDTRNTRGHTDAKACDLGGFRVSLKGALVFTIVLIVLAAIVVIVVAVHEVRSWRKPGRHIGQNASMDSGQTNTARLTQQTNIHDSNPFGGTPGSI